MGFPRQEYWGVLPFPSLGDLPNSGDEPRSPTLQADSLPSELPPGKPHNTCGVVKKEKKNQGLHFTPIRMPFFFYVGCAWSYFSCSMWNLELRHMNSQLQRVGSGSLTRDPTWIPCIGSREVLATEPPAKSLGTLF